MSRRKRKQLEERVGTNESLKSMVFGFYDNGRDARAKESVDLLEATGVRVDHYPTSGPAVLSINDYEVIGGRSIQSNVEMLLEKHKTSKEVLQEVFDAAARTYNLSGHQVYGAVATGNDLEMFIPDLKRIECVHSDEEPLDISKLSEHRRNGLEVWVLYPIGFFGEVCDQLRGKVDRVQAWWQEDGKYKFGTPQMA